MLILIIDSCGSSCGVGVWQDGDMLAQMQEHMERGQDARLMPMVVAVMAQAGLSFSNVDKIAVTRGPGSFTGVRVGLAAARGIGLAAGKPVIGIDRFAIYKSRLDTTEKNLLVVINSKRAELFCRFYPAADKAHEACMMNVDEISLFVAGHPNTDIAGDIIMPDADIISTCAQLAASAEAQSPDFYPRPFYLRAPDVTFAAKKSP